MVFLMTGLIPISEQIHQDKLLLLGQVLRLDHNRFERRATLQALNVHTPTIQGFKEALRTANLPSLEDLIINPIPYEKWKSLVKSAIAGSVLTSTSEGILRKSSLHLWLDKLPLNPAHLYPKDPPSCFIRKALTVRAQMLSSTYLVQSRVAKIKPGRDCNNFSFSASLKENSE